MCFFIYVTQKEKFKLYPLVVVVSEIFLRVVALVKITLISKGMRDARKLRVIKWMANTKKIEEDGNFVT